MKTVIGCFLYVYLIETNRRANLQQCLTDIRTAGTNNSAFWFGTKYTNECPNGNDGTLDCFNPNPAAQNVFTRLFGPGFDASVIDRFLKVEFTSTPGALGTCLHRCGGARKHRWRYSIYFIHHVHNEDGVFSNEPRHEKTCRRGLRPGTYSGCGNYKTINTTWNQDIDPLSGLVTSPWYTRFLPFLQWASLPGELFTLYVYDAGIGPTHGAYTNIRGNDLSTATVTFPYRGPGNPSLIENLYVFLLFKQSGQLTVSTSFATNRAQSISPINFTQLISEWHLQGPIGINWIRVKGDLYSVGRVQDTGFINNCPAFLETELNKMNRPSFLPSPVYIDVSVEVTYETKAMEFYACCSKHTYSHETFSLNPIGNPVYDTYKVSHAPKVSFLKRGFLAQASFAGEIHTLMMLDADIVNPVVGNATHPLILWLVANIRDGNITTDASLTSMAW